MDKEITKKQLAINLIKDDLNKYGVTTRKRAIKLFMKATGINTMNGSVLGAVNGGVSHLMYSGYIIAKEPGMYIKA